MGFRRAFVIFAAGASLACAASATGKISIDEVAALGLMPTQSTPDKPGTWAQVPYLKLYFDGNLIFSGMPGDFQKVLAVKMMKAQPRIHADVKVRQLSSELTSLKTKRTGTGPAVVVAYISDPCPPCESLIAGAISKLQPLGYGAIEQIRVVVH